MTNRIYFPQTTILPASDTKKAQNPKSSAGLKTSFGQILDKKLHDTIKFSNHAQERMKARNIELSDADMNKLAEAVGKAREKGARDSLVLMSDMALVVSVKNNTVITALDGQNMKDNIFTNIDSAVII